jgi:hypothetical protein
MSFYDESKKAVFDSCDMLTCPKCGGENMHISGPAYPGVTSDLYRDTTVEIPMYGECGHEAKLSLYTHKGSTYARWHSIQDSMTQEEEHQGP